MTHVPSADFGPWEIASLASPVDRETIRFGVWARDPNFRRVVVFVNGRSEWIEKYAFLPEAMGLPDDCALLTWDHRGQGGSGGARGHVTRFQDFVDDAQAVVSEVVGDKPYAMVAHSMGGLIATFACLHGFLDPACLALSAPLFRLPDNPLPRSVSLPVSRVVQLARQGHRPTGAGGEKAAFAGNPLTQSPEAYRLIQHSPYRFASPTFSWVAEVFRATRGIFRDDALRARKTPILVLGGSDERVIDPAAFSQWVQKAARFSPAPVHYRMIQGARHELLNEVEPLRARALAEVDGWFNQFFR